MHMTISDLWQMDKEGALEVEKSRYDALLKKTADINNKLSEERSLR